MGLLDSLLLTQDRQAKGMNKSQQVDELIRQTQQGGLDKLFSSPKDSINNYLIKTFGSPAIAAGISGNIDVETGGSYDFNQKQKGGPGEGLFQFSTDKWKSDYKSFLKRGGRENSGEAQIDFIKSATESGKDHELGWRARLRLQEAFKTNDPAVISQAFSKHLEKPGSPHLKRRLKSSQEHFKQFTGE